MKKTEKLYALTESAIMIALAAVLSMCKLWQAPLGGSVTLCAMVPIMFVSLRHGAVWGLGVGFVYSLIQLLLGLNNLSYVPTTLGIIGCILLDYIFPYTVLGLAGIFMKIKSDGEKKIYIKVICGMLLCSVLRFIFHFLAGAIVWYEITKEGAWNDYVLTTGMWMYSFVYNITYLGPDAVIALAASPVLVKFVNILKNNK